MINAVASSIAFLRITRPDMIFHDMNVLWYVLPPPQPESGLLSDYLAMKDPLYRHTIYQPFRDGAAFVPTLVADRPSSSTDNDTPVTEAPRSAAALSLSHSARPVPSPQSLLCYEVHHMMWNARRVVPVMVFQCEGTDRTLDKHTRLIIPFCSVLEISQRVEALMNPSLKYDPAVRAPIPADLTYRFTEMDPQSRGHREATETTATLSSLFLFNTPADAAPLADPTSPILELVGIEADRKQKQMGNRASVVMDSHFGPFQYHVAEIEVFVLHKAGTFHVMADGVPHGPFHRVKITPLKFRDEQMTVPFATYLPTKL
eukprot:c20347_g1_i3.p1 GENE.c20347_g1_i3~~c20347_g1_i3.p1  ORF type:complete len:316 (+),score=58.16 c20347_g1_i3:101-1048(+)